jgi:hypothetical protein
MICGSFTMKSIPNGQEDVIYNGFMSNVPPPTHVTKTQDADGTWTVTAEWPPCPAKTTTSHSANNVPVAAGA